MNGHQGDAPRVGDIVAGKYRVDRVLGVGGMGVVVAATHEQLDQRVALKFLHAQLSTREDIVARFLREARAAVKIRSEHVARVLDVGTLETGAPYMVMEFLEGEDLEHVLRYAPVEETAAVGYLLEACEAIAEAHSLGIVHRDLKPANLFLAKSPSGAATVKVLDFGISKAPVTAAEKALTQEASLMGTPGYMSPEQLRSSRDVDARSDIWALGVILHELITMAPPFNGDSMAEVVAAIVTAPHPPAGIGRPSPLQPVIDRCLQKDPRARFADVGELALALAPFAPPRAERSVERILTVLGQPTDRASLVFPRLSSHSLADPPSAGALRSTDAGRAITNAGVTTSPGGSSGITRGDGARPLPVRSGLVAAVLAGAVLAGVGLATFAARSRGTTPSVPAGVAPELAAQTPPTEVARTASTHALVAAVPPSVVPAVPSSSASAPPTATAIASPRATASASTAPIVTELRPKPAPKGPATTTATAAPTVVPTASATQAPPTPACKVVVFYDADGTKHFRKDCP